MGETTLPSEEIRRLRSEGVLTESEIAVVAGDLLIAVDVVSQSRRVIQNESIVESKGSKRLLKG